MKKISLLLLSAVTLGAMVSCDPIDKLGPDLCPSADFTLSADDIVVTGLDADGKVDLDAGGLHITSKFTEVVKWDLKIVADDVSAMKEYSGESDSIDIRWFGNVDRLPVFKSGACSIELEVSCQEKVTKAFTISKDPTFRNLHKSYGVLIRDFDKNGFSPVAAGNWTPADGWFGFNVDEDNHFDYFLGSDSSEMGGRYGELYGKNSATTWYFGATSFPMGSWLDQLSTSNVDSLYVNFFCRGFGKENTGLEFGLMAPSGTFFHTEPISWEDWKLISVKLSDLKILSGNRAGEKLADVTSVTQCVLQLGANPEKSAELQSAYDFIIVTVGEPFAQ